MKTILLCLLPIFLIYSCRNNRPTNETDILKDKTSNHAWEEIINQEESPNLEITWSDFSKVYRYISQDQEEEQTIGINWINNDTIQYKLFISKSSCVLEFSGTATKKSLGEDLEIDEDENGAYPAIEYISNDSEYIYSIRVEYKKRQKIRFIYSSNRDTEKCEPIESKILYLINAH